MPEREAADLWALSDLCTPWCVHVVATLRIADHIAAGVTGIAGISSGTSSATVPSSARSTDKRGSAAAP